MDCQKAKLILNAIMIQKLQLTMVIIVEEWI